MLMMITALVMHIVMRMIDGDDGDDGDDDEDDDEKIRFCRWLW